MAKYGFNERWRDRDRAYRELPDALLERLFVLIVTLADRLYSRKRGPGQPPKVGISFLILTLMTFFKMKPFLK